MRYSLGFILALSLSGLQFLAIITVISTSYVSSERAMLEHARGLMDDAGSSAVEQKKRFLEPAAEAAELASRVLQNGVVNSTDHQALEKYLFQHLKTKPQLSGIYFGDDLDNFVYVMRSYGPAVYRTKLVLMNGEIRTTELIWRDPDFAVVERNFDPADTFDPRQRQWFINANAAGVGVWTSPYIFFSSQKPGITVAAPVPSEQGAPNGVLGVDIEISAISSFLSDLKIGDEGVAIILSGDGDVIAHPDLSQVRVQNDDGTLSFVDIREFNDPITRAAFANFNTTKDLQETSLQAEFVYQNDKFMTLLLPISGIDLPWTIAVFAPENDFVQGIKDNRRRNIWVAAIISLVTAVAGVTLAEYILKPVRAFAVRTALVSQGEVPTTDPLPRTYQELSKANATLINEIAQRRNSDAKVQDLSRELSHFSRVNVMGQMATGLAHELSQPLTAITQNVDTAITVAKLDPIPTDELLSILNELDDQAHQGGDIIRALRGFIRKDEASSETFDVNELVLQTCRLMRHETETLGITVANKIGVLPMARGNRVQIAQVLVNLMRNSVAAMTNAKSTAPAITITANNTDGFIEVWVEDSGPGVGPEVKLLKQFQTSKPDGLGLGLSISRTIIEANKGRLWHERPEPQQSRFCFTVPQDAS
jgi:C4-dicarboxylate-specific signal transduction histidine kinase